MLTVTDIKAAPALYQKAPGFTRRGGFMNALDGKPTHAELRPHRHEQPCPEPDSFADNFVYSFRREIQCGDYARITVHH